MLKPVYFAFVKTMLEFFLQTTHFVKSRAHSPRPTSKIIAMIALRRAILMKANPMVSLHAHRLFSGRACSCKKDPCSKNISNNCLFHHLTSSYITLPILAKIRLCIKVGRGLRDACVGTWDLGTRDEGLEDIKYRTRGRQTQGR